MFLSVDYYQRFQRATTGIAAVDLRIVANSGTLGVRNFRCALLTSAFSAGSLAVSPAPICLRMWRRNNGSVATITHVPPSSYYGLREESSVHPLAYPTPQALFTLFTDT